MPIPENDHFLFGISVSSHRRYQSLRIKADFCFAVHRDESLRFIVKSMKIGVFDNWLKDHIRHR